MFENALVPVEVTCTESRIFVNTDAGIKGLPIGCIYRDYKDHTGVRFAKRHVLFIVRNVDL